MTKHIDMPCICNGIIDRLEFASCGVVVVGHQDSRHKCSPSKTPSASCYVRTNNTWRQAAYADTTCDYV